MRIKLRFCFIFIFIFAANIQAGTIGYGHANSILSSEELENFYLGFELGLRKMVNDEKKIKEILKVHKNNNKEPDGPLQSLEKLIKDDVSSVFGYPTSHEALMVSKILAKKKMLAFFGGASHGDLETFGPTIYSVGESAKSSIRHLISFIEAKMSGKKGVLLVNNNAVFSRNMAKMFSEKYKKINPSFEIDIIEKNENNVIADKDIQRIKKNGYSFYLFTSYIQESHKVIEQLGQNEIQATIFSTSAWPIGNMSYLMRVLSSWKHPIYSYTFWHKDIPESKKFTSEFRSRFGVEPNDENAFGYDLGVIAGTLVNRVKGEEITKEIILNSFNADRCFLNTSTGKICFDANGGFPERKFYSVYYRKGAFHIYDK